MISLRRFASAGSVLALLALTGCASLAGPKAAHPDAGEWTAGKTDLRKTTAIVRVSPPARLKAAFEEVAARSDDPDYADFLRAHAGGGFGSGFSMVHTSAEGTAAFVVTNRHVISESEDAEVSFGDVSWIADGKSVRLAVNTKDGSDMDLIWKFEHGSWRVAGGDLIEPSPIADYDESRPAPASKKTKPATKAGARTNAKGGK